MRTTFSIIIDTIFIFIVSFFIFNVVLYYFFPYPYTIVLSALFSIIISIVSFRLFNNKNSKNKIKLADKKLYENTMFEMNLKSKGEQENILIRALERKKLGFLKKNGGILIKEKNIIVYMCFDYNATEKAKIVKAYNYLNKNEYALLISQGFSLEAKNFCSKFNGKIKIMEGQEFFSKLKEIDCLPKLKIDSSKTKKKRFNFNYMQRKNAKRFLLSGISFLILSRFVPIKIYYVVFGCMFLLLSLIIRLFGKENSNLAIS